MTVKLIPCTATLSVGRMTKWSIFNTVATSWDIKIHAVCEDAYVDEATLQKFIKRREMHLF